MPFNRSLFSAFLVKNTLLLLFALFFALPVFAQNNTIVQTFKWTDNFRKDTFHFPDDPGQSWRKIYMDYTMRCRNGSVCGEWDYSCNTFLTDPTRIDSTRQNFPEYVISGFTGTAFEYTFDPTYTYYQYLQHQTQISGGNSIESTVGAGNTELALAGVSGVSKTQLLFTAAELSTAGLSAGDIHGLKLQISQPGSELGFFKIRLKNTSKTALSADTPDLEGFTEVFFQNTPVNAVGTLLLPFYQSFNWDGVSNLLIECSSTAALANNARVLASDAGYEALLLNEQVDHALGFGSGSFVDIPVAPLAGISNEITVSFWSLGNANVLPVNSTLFEGLNSSGGRGINVHLPWSNGSVYWDCGGSGASYDRINKQADPSMYEGQWNHWAFSKNATTGVMNIYFNGQLWHSGTGKTLPIDIQNFILGGSANHDLSFYGKIDEFQVWDKALDEAIIAAWMRKSITPNHPDYVHLRAYYPFEEGNGTQTTDSSPEAVSANIHLPNWQTTRGNDLYKNFSSTSLRPNTTFLQGDLMIADQTAFVMDSVLNAQNQVLHYEVVGTDLMILDTNYYFPAGAMNILDAATDTIVGQIQAPADGIIEIQNLTYYLKRAARFELLSLVTPYGNGLNLGASGKTFRFDVTDFAPILTGNKVLSIEFGGEWQEDLDVKFVFVPGEPSRPVLDIQNVWPQARGGFQNILDDLVFEPRDIPLNSAASAYKLRTTITGHGQNGEFVPRQHYMNVNGGSQEFQFDVWKYCGKNPIYPQGGTWIFDRAGWCPGMASDVHEFMINEPPGSNINLDYGLNGGPMSEANYLVSSQLVSYGPYTHNLDASLETIMRPNNARVEFARINPACSAPIVLVENTGASTITSLQFAYEVPGGGSDNFTWTGVLEPAAKVEITLPVLSPSFWTTAVTTKVFQVEIVKVNNQQDDEADNNLSFTTFTPAQSFSVPSPMRIRTTTNLHGGDNSYTIKDASGNVVMSRNQMLSSTSYVDLLELPNGCYTLKFEDSGNDGLSFWYFPEYGSGVLNLARQLSSGAIITAKGFDPDFGGGVQFDFSIISTAVGTQNIESARMMSLYPNPAYESVTIDFQGFAASQLDISIRDLSGRDMRRVTAQTDGNDPFTEQVSLEGLPAGMYFVRVTDGKSVWVSELVKQ